MSINKYGKNYFTRRRIMFWMLICESSSRYHLSSQIFREWKLVCSTKVTLYASRRGGLFIVHGSLNSAATRPFSFAILFAPTTAVRQASHEKFIAGLANMLLIAHRTSRYINAIGCASQVLVQRESFIFYHCLLNVWYHCLAVTILRIERSYLQWFGNLITVPPEKAVEAILLD